MGGWRWPDSCLKRAWRWKSLETEKNSALGKAAKNGYLSITKLLVEAEAFFACEPHQRSALFKPSLASLTGFQEHQRSLEVPVACRISSAHVLIQFCPGVSYERLQHAPLLECGYPER